MIRYANGEIATEDELNAIAKTFGSHSWTEWERKLRAGEARRRRLRTKRGTK